MGSKITLETFYQEFKDFSNYLTTKVDSIEQQTKITNGRVNKHDTLLALLGQNYKTCPARQMSNLSNQHALKNNKIAFSALIIAIITTISNLILHFI